MLIKRQHMEINMQRCCYPCADQETGNGIARDLATIDQEKREEMRAFWHRLRLVNTQPIVNICIFIYILGVLVKVQH